jgi:predicted ATPase
VRANLPSGTVTFLFTDVEASTKLLHELGEDGYAEALGRHRRVLREAFDAHCGVEVDTQGDAFFVAFPTAPGALEAAAEAEARLAEGPIRVRIGIHTGTPLLGEEGYVGVDVHRAARIAAAGHGGQVLVSAATASLLDSDELVDLGEHRLKDLSAPERIFQLGSESFPPLKSLYQTNLPIPSTPFLGRERELEEVLRLLSQADLRLLTLTGAGGTGKTRLGLQAAGALAEHYPDGVWWVPLAALRDPRLVLPTAAQILGAAGGFVEHIRDKKLLVLFDNFEHVLEASSELADLLAGCPRVELLVTSREPLHVTSEQEYPVPPLVHGEGVAFFAARARTARPEFQLDEHVSEICRRLDDLPLALELAAARVKALSTQQILERLEQRLPLLTGGARDLPERQRTLRATIEWSYELLSPEEQRLFARLAAFRGGCTVEAAENVAETDVDTLQSLVEKSLLRHNERRFWMLETIREYATERLEASGEAEELRQRHALHYLALAERAEPHIRVYAPEWLESLAREHDNVRAGLDWLEASGQTELALRFAGTAFWYWSPNGHLEEGRRRLEPLLFAEQRPTSTRAKGLIAAADLAVDAGIPPEVRSRAQEALTLHRRLGDERGAAYALFLLGFAYAMENEMMRARPLFEESVEAFRRLGDDHYTMASARRLAWTYQDLGELDAARTLHEENLRRARALGDRVIEMDTLGPLGTIAIDQGRLTEGVSLLKEGLRLARELNDRYDIALNLCRLARALAHEGSAEDVVILISRWRVMAEELGVKVDWVAEMNEETLAMVRDRITNAAFADAAERAASMSDDDAVALALESVGE